MTVNYDTRVQGGEAPRLSTVTFNFDRRQEPSTRIYEGLTFNEGGNRLD